MASQNGAYLRLQVAVNNMMMPHQRERLKHLAGEAPDESGGEAHETVGLDELVQIDAQQFRSDAEVVAEVEVLRHLEGMMLLLLVLKEPSVL